MRIAVCEEVEDPEGLEVEFELENETGVADEENIAAMVVGVALRDARMDCMSARRLRVG